MNKTLLQSFFRILILFLYFKLYRGLKKGVESVHITDILFLKLVNLSIFVETKLF